MLGLNSSSSKTAAVSHLDMILHRSWLQIGDIAMQGRLLISRSPCLCYVNSSHPTSFSHNFYSWGAALKLAALISLFHFTLWSLSWDILCSAFERRPWGNWVRCVLIGKDQHTFHGLQIMLLRVKNVLVSKFWNEFSYCKNLLWYFF